MKNKTTRLAESIRNQHVAISVAAGLARAQLVPNPVGVYDARHLSDMLDIIADAIARVVPLYSLNAVDAALASLQQAAEKAKA
jgi:hypothetical protein